MARYVYDSIGLAWVRKTRILFSNVNCMFVRNGWHFTRPAGCSVRDECMRLTLTWLRWQICWVPPESRSIVSFWRVGRMFHSLWGGWHARALDKWVTKRFLTKKNNQFLNSARIADHGFTTSLAHRRTTLWRKQTWKTVDKSFRKAVW